MSLFSLLFAFAKANPLEVGDKAPELTATTDTGAKLNLGEVYKKQTYTLVYFYPRAGTSGCTKQGCSLRDANDELAKRGVAIIGVSTDGVEAQKKFKDDNHFPFPLIADTDKAVISAFGVPTRTIANLGEISARQAYLIKDGKIIYADHKGTTDKQGETILKVLDEQKG